MTLEEAKIILINRGFVEINGDLVFDGNKWRNAITVISKWLEQQPCEDCISRQAVLSYICNDLGFGDEENGYDLERKIAQEEIYNFVEKMPSVTPKTKTGKWIDDEFGSKCSCCGIHTHLDKFDRPMKFEYCSMCGAKMIKSQESEG